jgi:hypothetical protein
VLVLTMEFLKGQRHADEGDYLESRTTLAVMGTETIITALNVWDVRDSYAPGSTPMFMLATFNPRRRTSRFYRFWYQGRIMTRSLQLSRN